MKNYPYSQTEKKLNKKRLSVFAVFVIWFTFMTPFVDESDWLLRITAQMIPLLTYEKQYGNPNTNYAADYQVPEWFYEDEEDRKSVV